LNFVLLGQLGRVPRAEYPVMAISARIRHPLDTPAALDRAQKFNRTILLCFRRAVL